MKTGLYTSNNVSVHVILDCRDLVQFLAAGAFLCVVHTLLKIIIVPEGKWP